MRLLSVRLYLSPTPKIHGRTAEWRASKCDESEITGERFGEKGAAVAVMVLSGYALTLLKDASAANKD
eukprot:621909-Ditylum_brightwellii.AAC.2